MKKVVLLVFGLLMFCSVGLTIGASTNVISSNPGYMTYQNGRFGYTIDYPSNFIIRSSAGNGDGITLASPDNQTTLSVYGGNNSGLNAKDYYNLTVKNIKGELGYNTLEDTWYVVTWRENGRIYYEKMIVGSASYNGFTFSCPEEQKSWYDSILTNVERFFRHGNINCPG